MCTEFDVTARALRFYEAKELLFPQREGQKRLYDNRDKARLKLILRGKRFGFSLEDIRELLNLYHHGDGQFTQLSATYERGLLRLDAMRKQKEELEVAIVELDDQLDLVRNLLAERSPASKNDDS
jgi:DNA-binding transcriptional MerR regulator